MIDYTTDAGFEAALKRARAAEAAYIAGVVAGTIKVPESVDAGDMLKKQADRRTRMILNGETIVRYA